MFPWLKHQVVCLVVRLVRCLEPDGNGGNIQLERVSLKDQMRLLGYDNLQRIARVLLDAKNRELNSNVERWVGDVRLLVT